MTIKVYRSGVTARYRTLETTHVAVSSYQHTVDRHGLPAVRVTFTMASKGGGDTFVDIRLDPEHFTELAATMMLADPVAAIRAFGAAMVNGLPAGAA